LPLEDEDDDTYVPDWKPKHDVVPKPGRGEGDRHPDLPASIEKTRDDFGMVDQRPPSPRARLEKLLAGVPQPQAGHIRELFDESLPPRRRGRPSSDEWRAFRIAREVEREVEREFVKGKAVATAKGRGPSMKSIYGKVAKLHRLSPKSVGRFYREHRELAEFLERSEARHTAALASAKG